MDFVVDSMEMDTQQRSNGMTREEAQELAGLNWSMPKTIAPFIDEIYDSFEERTCESCQFRNDTRKCPMSDVEAMSDKNYCYNWNKEK